MLLDVGFLNLRGNMQRITSFEDMPKALETFVRLKIQHSLEDGSLEVYQCQTIQELDKKAFEEGDLSTIHTEDSRSHLHFLICYGDKGRTINTEVMAPEEKRARRTSVVYFCQVSTGDLTRLKNEAERRQSRDKLILK